MVIVIKKLAYANLLKNSSAQRFRPDEISDKKQATLVWLKVEGLQLSDSEGMERLNSIWKKLYEVCEGCDIR